MAATPETESRLTEVNGANPQQPQSEAGKSQAEVEAIRLRAMAANLRAEAAALEAEQSASRAKESERIFKSFDSNSDGSLDAAELRKGLEALLKQSVTEQRAQQLLEMLDTNGDGVLQPNELLSPSGLAIKLSEIAKAEANSASAARAEAMKASELAKREAALAALVNDAPPTPVERAISTLPFLLPLLDGAVYGRFLLDGPAQAGNPAVIALLGLLALFRSIPLSQIAAFIGLSFLGDNLKINRLIRHNALQAVYLDVALFPASLLLTITTFITKGNVPQGVLEYGSDAVFLGLFAAVAYSVVTTAIGGTPDQVPLVSNVVRNRLDRMSAREFQKRNEDDDKRN